MNTSPSSAIISPIYSSLKPTGHTYLCFQINEQTQALFLMDQIQEVVTVPLNQVTPMPNMPACVLGLLSRRSRVLWVVDVAHLLMNQPLAPSLMHYELIVIRVDLGSRHRATPLAISHRHALLGLVVQKIRGSRYVPPESIQIPRGQASTALEACLKGYWLQQDVFMSILDAEAIGRLPALQLH